MATMVAVQPPLPNATCRLTISHCSPASFTIRGRPRREATTGINTAEAKGKVCTLANTAEANCQFDSLADTAAVTQPPPQPTSRTRSPE